mgnify:CR=1 FL=1
MDAKEKSLSESISTENFPPQIFPKGLIDDRIQELQFFHNFFLNETDNEFIGGLNS